MGGWLWKTPRGEEILAPDPGPLNPAGTTPGQHATSANGSRPNGLPAGDSPDTRRRRRVRAS
ncbi:hypothetical protein RKE29_05770 [Streptomyces sp. B1866]|uniref:hypothetical protein n=1 Tax=Streptomyces sp. B1866 TaxID=3075431 RepID=UPI00288E4AD2|nr:hypothetical protein [Streptomyces sp. B1866]MDT3396152.1 hypothetical protein [Streptomyces sp. B1866]